MTGKNSIFALFRAPLTGRHVLTMIVAFFLVIFAVNGVFVYVSLQSHPGVTSEDAYRKGLDHNRTLENADRQNARGWKTVVTAADGVVEIRLSDRAGMPLTGLAVRGQARRPVHDRADTELVLREIGAGRYRAVGTTLSAGRWDLLLSVEAGTLPSYRIDHAVEVRG